MDQPRINLGEVIKDTLLHRLYRIVVGSRIEQPYLHLVMWLIRFDPQVVGVPGFELAGYKASERTILLMGPFIDSPPLFIGIHLNGTWNGRGWWMNVWQWIEIGEVKGVRYIALL